MGWLQKEMEWKQKKALCRASSDDMSILQLLRLEHMKNVGVIFVAIEYSRRVPSRR